MRRFLPLARLRASTFRPLAVAILLRKPCSFLRCRFLGWYVRSMPSSSFRTAGNRLLPCGNTRANTPFRDGRGGGISLFCRFPPVPVLPFPPGPAGHRKRKTPKNRRGTLEPLREIIIYHRLWKSQQKNSRDGRSARTNSGRTPAAGLLICEKTASFFAGMVSLRFSTPKILWFGVLW